MKDAPESPDQSFQEIEVKYLQTLSVVEKTVVLDDLYYQEIRQCYFSPGKIRNLLLPLLAEQLPAPNPPTARDYRNGRVRSAVDRQGCQFTLTVKGPREGYYQRREYEIEIGESLFHSLSRQSDQGEVAKRRHFLPGHLQPGDRELSVTAAIDCLTTAAGYSCDWQGGPPVVLIEVELAHLDQAAALQRGEHSFACLKNAILIATLPPPAQRIIRMRYLAQAGLDDAFRAVTQRCFAATTN